MCVFVCVHTDLDKRYFWPEDKVVALSSKSRVRFVLEYEHNVSCKGDSVAEFNMHYRKPCTCAERYVQAGPIVHSTFNTQLK